MTYDQVNYLYQSKGSSVTTTYFTDMVLLVVTLVTTTFSLIFVGLLVYYSELKVDVTVSGTLVLEPKNENLLMTLVEVTEQGHRMRDLLTFSVATNSNIVEIAGKNIDVGTATERIISGIVRERPYLVTFTVNGDEAWSTSNGEPSANSPRSQMMFSANGNIGVLEVVGV